MFILSILYLYDKSSILFILYFKGKFIENIMGAEQPKKITRVTKAQIDIGTLKARIHLELMRDRKNG